MVICRTVPLSAVVVPTEPGWGNGLPLLSLPSLRSVSIFFPSLFVLYSSWFCVRPSLAAVLGPSPRAAHSLLSALAL